MLTTDYHTHTTFSPDARSAPFVMCEQALALGLEEIAFTEHVEWHPRGRYHPDFERYFATIAACRARYGPRGLRVLSGVELGNPHHYLRETAELLATYPFDVTIGSLHWLGDLNVQRPECFAGRDPFQVYEAYFTELTHMAAVADVDIIGHFDRILWQGVQSAAPFDVPRLEPVVRDLWEVVAARGVALELNTSLLRFSPSWRYELTLMLHWFREMGGRRLVINSDAHAAEQIGQNFPLALELLRTAGFLARGPAQPARPRGVGWQAAGGTLV